MQDSTNALKQRLYQQVYDGLIASRRQSKVIMIFLGIITIIFAVSAWPGLSKPASWAIDWFILYPPAILEGQWWRLISGQLLHANWGHLLSNGFGLYIFGSPLSWFFHERGLIACLLISLILGGLFSVWFLPNPTLGASGMTYGCLGAYVTAVFGLRFYAQIAQQNQLIRDAVVIIGLYALINASTPNVNWWAHGGGFLGGALFCLWYLKQLDQSIQKQLSDLERSTQ